MNQQPDEVSSDSENEHENVSTSIPPATLSENKPSETHARSHAAHLEDGQAQPHTKPAGNLRQGSYPTGRRQP